MTRTIAARTERSEIRESQDISPGNGGQFSIAHAGQFIKNIFTFAFPFRCEFLTAVNSIN